jgi:hypothetical protein
VFHEVPFVAEVCGGTTQTTTANFSGQQATEGSGVNPSQPDSSLVCRKGDGYFPREQLTHHCHSFAT